MLGLHVTTGRLRQSISCSEGVGTFIMVSNMEILHKVVFEGGGVRVSWSFRGVILICSGC